MKKSLVLLLFLSFILTGCGGKLTKDKTFSAFKTVDLEGNEVTEALFAEKEITMVHFWGSTCGPCLSELPELQKLYEALPDNVNMIGILADVPIGYETGVERAKQALAKENSTYQNLLLDDVLSDYAKSLILTPYTVFVNREGKIVSSVKGAAGDGYIEELERLVSDLKWKK